MSTNQIWFYNRFGYPEILLLKQSRFVDQKGYNLGYIKNNFLYNYKGRHCGWIEKGVIRDLDGHAVGFMKGASDFPSPIFPVPQIPPIPPIPKIPSIPAIPQIPKIKPIKHFGWSNISLIALFK
jgi:hypothetical protein